MLEKKLAMFPLDKIQITDDFWKGYMELVRTHVIPYQWEALNDRIDGAEPSRCIQNFRRAAGLEEGGFEGMVFQDSDVYKWLEAVAYSLTWHPDEALEKTADEAIDLIARAQQPDGYLDTYYILNGLDQRFTNLTDNHEMYCMGHMVEAAVAYYHATGKRKLLDVAAAFVNCAYENLGREPGKKRGYPGHEVAEMALVALYGITKDKRHLELAKYFIDERGQQPLYFAQEKKESGAEFFWKDSYFKYQYYQAGLPVREQDKAEGHAVRAVYLYSGMAEVASATEDQELFEACERLWNNIVEKQMYVTGAIGATAYGESFTFDYDLPNDTVYAETCAAIGLIFFARRMFEITKDSRYADVMERALYNGVISGMSLDGTKFFYVNPLEVVPGISGKAVTQEHDLTQRPPWYACACCPPNVARLLSSLGSYAYSQGENTFFTHLYLDGEVESTLGYGLSFDTDYPRSGEICCTFHGEAETTLAFHIPAWSQQTTLTVNGEAQDLSALVKDGYAYVTRRFREGDQICLTLDMAPFKVYTSCRVPADTGCVAVQRGPVVYCAEGVDNQGDVLSLSLAAEGTLTEEPYDPDLLGGIVPLMGEGWRSSSGEALYSRKRPERKPADVRLVPYCVWGNRGENQMRVWLPEV